MAENAPATCGPCAGGVCGEAKLTLKDGLWTNNPLSIQILGICSALAVTNRFENSLVMGAALIFVCIGSNLFVSLLRKVTPRRIRMIAEVVIIATFVIVFDQVLKARYWDMSKQLGPYVGLIITNCIIMGRAEAFALQNGPVLSMVDGAANGLGYAAVLAIIGFVRELLGTGVVPGVAKLSALLTAAATPIVGATGPIVAAVIALVVLVGLGLLLLRTRWFTLYACTPTLLLLISAAAMWRWWQNTPADQVATLGAWYTPNQLMILAPGAFFALGFLVAVFNAINGVPEGEEEAKP